MGETTAGNDLSTKVGSFRSSCGTENNLSQDKRTTNFAKETLQSLRLFSFIVWTSCRWKEPL